MKGTRLPLNTVRLRVTSWSPVMNHDIVVVVASKIWLFASTFVDGFCLHDLIWRAENMEPARWWVWVVAWLTKALFTMQLSTWVEPGLTLTYVRNFVFQTQPILLRRLVEPGLDVGKCSVSANLGWTLVDVLICACAFRVMHQKAPKLRNHLSSHILRLI